MTARKIKPLRQDEDDARYQETEVTNPPSEVVANIRSLATAIQQGFSQPRTTVDEFSLKVGMSSGNVELLLKEKAIPPGVASIARPSKPLHIAFDGLIQRARLEISKGQFKRAGVLLSEATANAKKHGRGDLVDLSHKIQRELANLQNQRLKNFTPGKIYLHREPWSYMPQTLFFIEQGKSRYFGRKLLSDQWLNREIQEFNCSKISSPMLLGTSVHEQITENEVQVCFRPFSEDEQHQVFEGLKADPTLEIKFPYPMLDGPAKAEKTSSSEGWTLLPGSAENLGLGERHLRRHTTDFLRSFDMSSKLVYDPACSTGQFLAEIKQVFPTCITVGQDLSLSMVESAKHRVDRIFHGNAAEPCLPEGSADFIFIRFLNSEVVTTAAAQSLFPTLMKVAKQGAKIIVLGHTPVLLSKAYFETLDVLVEACSARDSLSDAIFQYYVLTKK